MLYYNDIGKLLTILTIVFHWKNIRQYLTKDVVANGSPDVISYDSDDISVNIFKPTILSVDS